MENVQGGERPDPMILDLGHGGEIHIETTQREAFAVSTQSSEVVVLMHIHRRL